MDQSRTSQDLDRSSDSDPTFMEIEESDDEETIYQEELLEPVMQPTEELRLLADDLNVSIEDLRSQCGYRMTRGKKIDFQALVGEEELLKETQILQEPKSLKELSKEVISEMEMEFGQPGPSAASESSEYKENEVSELTKFYLTNFLTECLNSEDDGDADYKPLEKLKPPSESRVGSEYQVEIPDHPVLSLKMAATEALISHDDEIQWTPTCTLNEDEIEAYLWEVYELVQNSKKEGIVRPVRRRVAPDNEEALKILMTCDFDKNLAFDKFKESLLESKTNSENDKKQSLPMMPNK